MRSVLIRRSAEAQADGTEALSGVIRDYLALAEAHYKVPENNVGAYEKDPQKFAAQYFGIFSCEGQGLERIPGSNSCKDRLPSTGKSGTNARDYLMGTPKP